VVDPHTGETEGEDPGVRPLSMQECRPNEQIGRQQQRGGDGQQQRGSQRQQQGGRPAASRGGEASPTPGLHGHPARKAPDLDEVTEEPGEVRAGEEGGRSRSVHVTNPNRKRKRVA
jgi:hypothetical protein